MSKEIPLTKGEIAIVDDEDYDFLTQWKWCYVNSGYAMRREYLGQVNGKQKSRYILMHRQLMGAEKGEEVDHVNHDKLDNRKNNLRVCDSSENSANQNQRVDNTSGRRGVYWYKAYKKWMASITFRGETKHLGYFDDKEDAVRARVSAEKEIFGDFANVNI